MDKKKAAELLDDKITEVINAVWKVAPDFDEQTIHAFRVAVKKLRAYLRLLKTEHQQPKLGLAEKFHELYDTAGRIRDAQLRIKKAAMHATPLDSYTSQLRHTIMVACEDWYAQYKINTIEGFKDALYDKQLQDLPAITLLVFMTEHIAVLKDATSADPDDERVHACRKSVKDMLYNSKLAEERWPKAYAHIAHLPLAKLEELSDLLGRYNDLRLLLASYLAFMPLAETDEERSELELLAKRGAEKKAGKRATLLHEMKQFVVAATV